MRLKPPFWFLISLLLFAAALCTWQYAEKRAAGRRAPTAKADAMQHPPLINAAATNAAAAKVVAKRKSYRISNTSQNIAQLLHNSHALILRNALIDTEAPVALNIPAHLRAKGAPGSYLVQADRPLDRDFYAELSRAGASYISYVPDNAALVQASPAQATNLAANADVVAVLPYEPYYKLDNALLPSAVEQLPQTNALSVTTFPGQRDAALAALTQLGATLIGEDRSPFGPTLIVNVPAGRLTAVAQLPLAQEIEVYTPRRIMNDLTRVRMGVAANTLLGTPNYLNLTGSNVTVNLNDTGVDATHPDFGPAGRLLGDSPGSLTDADGHGTHVAGIIAGNGSKSATVTNLVPGSVIPGADFRGKATNATLYVQALDLVFGPFVGDAFLQENASSNLGPTNLISNNSWGYGSTVYDIHAASYDAATRDAQPNVDGEQPLLFVFAAGNSGNGSDNGIDGAAGTIDSPATAKNVITVGASDSPRFITNEVSYDGVTSNEVFYGGTDNSNLVAYFSSCGNVDAGVEGTFGRFKPDVVAPGVFIVSCRATNFVDPTNQTIVTDYPFPGQTDAPNHTNIYPFYIPDDASAVVVVVSSNAASPTPFPNMRIFSDPFDPPTDVVSLNNFYALTTFTPGEVWFFGVAPPANQPGPVDYDVNIYLFETNFLGNYYTVLSNMNNSLRPWYRYENGTSMAAPAVSGTLALMQEFLQARMNITNPSPALLKALLINGSRSLGVQYDFNVNTQGANEQGWGLPNLTNCLPLSLTNATPSMVLINQSANNALATGQYQTYTINCADTNAVLHPLRITLVWTDPPGDPASGVALVNNLDLTVADNSGTNIYIGNDFLSGTVFTAVSNPTNLPPGQSDNAVQNIYVNQGAVNYTAAGDSINNVQNVYINPANVPITFPLTVTISGTRVNVNAVPGQTANIVQDYALVISSDDRALSSPLTVATNGIVTRAPVLVTVVSNAVPLLHQRVGANEPNLYNYPRGLTNGDVSQWHFFIFTNNQFTNGQTATNVAFATFLPPNLSIPRNSSADIDLYVSTEPKFLTLNDNVVNAADKSVGRGGTESIIYTNSFAGEVYYIGVKSEDQQASDFGFYGVAQQAAFSTQNPNGSITATGTSLPVFIPNAVSVQPALVFAFLVDPNPLAQTIRRVTTTVGIEHGNPSDLYGTLQFSGATIVLNHNSGPPGGFTNTYDDLQENPSSGDVLSDGPGSLTQYVGQTATGLWLLTEADNALTQTGYVTAYSVTVDPQPILGGFFITLGANQWFDDFVAVPNDATNLIISAIYESEGTNAAGNGPIGIYLTNTPDLNTGDYGSNGIFPPGGSLTLGTNPPAGDPPLTGGLWYFGIYNSGTAPVSLFVEVQIQESLTPNLVQTYTNSGLPVPLTTDGHTQSQVCITNGQQVVSLQVGVRIDDTNLDDLVLHLTSPEGTSVLLFEDRGGLAATNLGLTLTNGPADYVYTVFTENTNLTTTPIKFAPPPFGVEVDIPTAILWSNSFETVPAGVYTNNNTNAVFLEGWLVTNNVVNILTTNGPGLLTNDEVGIVTDPNGDQFTNNLVTNSLGSNYLALTSGHIIQTFGATNIPFTSANGFNIINGQVYQLQFYAKPLGITDWWPADNDADDIIGADDGTATNMIFDAGEADRAFTFDGSNSVVSFGTNAGNFGTNDFSIDFWIKTASSNGAVALLEKGPCTAATGYFGLFLTNGSVLYDDPDSGVFQSTSAVSDGLLYHHVALTRQGGLLSVYIDGALDSASNLTGIVDIDNSDDLVAGESACSVAPYVGDLDELDLYNRALSPAEVYAIYHAGSLGKYSTNSILPNFDLTIDGIATNNIILTNASGGWQLFTNSFVATSDQVTIEFSGNALGVLLDDIQLIQLPATNYNNYYLPEEPLTPFVGENPLGCWTLDVWDTRNDSPLATNGTLLAWILQVTTSSTNATLNALTNGVLTTNSVGPNSITYFAVDVPSYASFATNVLTVTGGGPLTLYFDQTALPTGGLPGDVILAGGVTSSSTNILATQGAPPPLLPGQRYFLGVQNNGATPATFSLEIYFNGVSNVIIPLTNAVAYTNQIGTNTMGANGPQYYSFLVPTNATMVSFQILNPTGGEVDLYASDGLPLPGPSDFDYASANSGTNDQFIVVTTNSLPVPLTAVSSNDVVPVPPSTWYLAVYNFAAITNVGYTIIATVVTNGEITIIPLTNGIPYNYTNAPPGYLANVLYSFTVTNTNSPAGIQFTVTNLSGAGNVELLAGLDVFPTPEEFYSGSFNAGTSAQLVQIGTNSALPSLDGVWYLAVPNTSATNVTYSIEATASISGSGPVTNQPLVLSGRISSPGGFTIYWVANPGQTYAVEVSTNLPTWTFVTNVTPPTTAGSYTDPTPMASQQARFYRLLTGSAVTAAPHILGASVALPANGFTIYWAANVGWTYTIEISTNLVNWAPVTNITTESTTGSYTDPTPVAGQPARFYRLLEP